MKIKGLVIRGKNKGKGLGFPTANLSLEGDLEVKSGVYAGMVNFDGKSYRSAIFIGKKCSVLEAHILDFSGDLYGGKIEVEIGKKIREVMKFDSDKELVKQIKKDIQTCSQEL
jgi:riboflavin kinase / FMN adenylyltransferase